MWVLGRVAVACAALLAATPAPGAPQQSRGGARTAEVVDAVFDLGGGRKMQYALSLPAGYDPAVPRPLVLALHPGGREPYYGSWFMHTIVEPALRGWGAIVVAPDVPDENWTTELSEQSVLALLDQVRDEHAIDPDRILVTGFSMGGRGAWHFVVRRPDIFTGAIVMATGPGRGSLESLSETPLYIIHSPDDEVVPYAPSERLALELADRGYPVQFMRLPGASHGMMGDYVGPLGVAGAWVAARWRDRETAAR